jgi:outer membrane protein
MLHAFAMVIVASWPAIVGDVVSAQQAPQPAAAAQPPAAPQAAQPQPGPSSQTPSAEAAPSQPTASAQSSEPVTPPPVPAPGLPPTQLPQGEKISLAEAVSTALRNQASIGIAANQVGQARAGLTIAQSAYRPQVLGGWQWNYTRSTGGQRFTTLGGVPVSVGGGAAQERHQTTLTTTYTLFDSGLRKAQLDRARASLMGASSGLDLARVSLTNRVASAYFDLALQQRNVALAREQVTQAQQHLELANARIAAGMEAPVDRFRFQSDLATAQLNLVAAENNERQAAITLRDTIGLPVGPALAAEEPPLKPAVAGLPSLEEAMAAAARVRPDLLQAQANVRAASASLMQARIGARPALNVDAGYIVKAEPSPSGTNLEISSAIQFPIFDAGLRRAEVRSAAEALSSAQLTLTQLEKDVQAQVAAARLAVTTAWERINTAAVGVTAARENLDAVNARYKVGLAIPVEVTDAELQYFTTELQAASALYDYFIALAGLRNAIGLPTHDFQDLAIANALKP